MPLCEEERLKMQKVFEGLISEQEESQFNGWIERCCKKEAQKAIFKTCFGAVSSPMELAITVSSMFNTQYDCRNCRALSFKIKGNDYFPLKHYKFAMVAYQSGILIQPSDRELLASLYNNLSAALFYLEEYGTSLQYCKKALEIKPTYEKVLARVMQCRQKLRESYDAIDYSTKIIVCVSRSRIPSKEMNKTEKRMNNELLIIKTIRQRNYRFDDGNVDEANLTPITDQLKDHRVSLIHGRLVWPAFIVFPDFGRIYLIQQFDENESLQAVICGLPPFSLDWCKYLPEFLQVYFLDHQENLNFIKIAKTLKEVLSMENYVIENGTPDFAVFVKGGKQEMLFVGAANLIESDFGNEERLKLRKVFDGFISDQEEHKLENWIKDFFCCILTRK